MKEFVRASVISVLHLFVCFSEVVSVPLSQGLHVTRARALIACCPVWV